MTDEVNPEFELLNSEYGCDESQADVEYDCDKTEQASSASHVESNTQDLAEQHVESVEG